MIREFIANSFIAAGRSFGRLTGLQLQVELSDHSIQASMEAPDKDTRAWDDSLYKSGNVFVDGYANPIKPRVNYNQDLEEPDTVELEEGEIDSEHEDDEGDTDGTHAYLITSGRYREYMRQDLISQLLTPESRWNLIVMGMIVLGVLLFANMLLTMWATGSF